MKIVYVSYNYLPQFQDPLAWTERIKPFLLVPEALGQHHEVYFLGQIGYKGSFKKDNVHFVFSDPGAKTNFPFQLHRLVRKIRPDVIVVPGFHFPLQILQLRFILGRKTKIIAQYHADKPGKGLLKIFQRLADRTITGYHFTSLSSAREWRLAGIIAHEAKCHEVSPVSVPFAQKNKGICREELGIGQAESVFLWVGRLHPNKDPVTVLDGFEKFASETPDATLYMLFQGGELEKSVRAKIHDNPTLARHVRLIGHIEHTRLDRWYSAADYLISGSHREGGSVALIEALCCGCIPIVTRIPSAMKVIEQGQYGYYYAPGHSDHLSRLLLRLSAPDLHTPIKMIQHYQHNYSPAAIADKIEALYDLKKSSSTESFSSVSLSHVHQIGSPQHDLAQVK